MHRAIGLIRRPCLVALRALVLAVQPAAEQLVVEEKSTSGVPLLCLRPQVRSRPHRPIDGVDLNPWLQCADRVLECKNAV